MNKKDTHLELQGVEPKEDLDITEVVLAFRAMFSEEELKQMEEKYNQILKDREEGKGDKFVELD